MPGVVHGAHVRAAVSILAAASPQHLGALWLVTLIAGPIIYPRIYLAPANPNSSLIDIGCTSVLGMMTSTVDLQTLHGRVQKSW